VFLFIFCRILYLERKKIYKPLNTLTFLINFFVFVLFLSYSNSLFFLLLLFLDLINFILVRLGGFFFNKLWNRLRENLNIWRKGVEKEILNQNWKWRSLSYIYIYVEGNGEESVDCVCSELEAWNKTQSLILCWTCWKHSMFCLK
jgi:hypothetical protein